ncbi:hypothetical protein [Demequina sp.]|uniref:hypothetical protein n=1 Tax=Demequina sp. TaxID=2050685 RepID=UPI003D0CFF30
MAREHVSVGEEIPDDALRDVVSQVASGRVTPEQGWVNLQSRRAAKARPDFEDQFVDLLPFLTAKSHHGAKYPYDTAGMGWRRSAVIADDMRATGVEADLGAGLTPSPAGFRATGEVMGETHVPGWDDLAEVYLFHKSFFPVLSDPDLEAELQNYRAAVARGELRIAEYRRQERRLLEADRG